MDISAYQHMNIRMSTRGKRPLRNLTPTDKIRAIQRIHNGETKASVSRDIGVPESTLRGWCKNEQKLRFMCRQLGATDPHSTIPTVGNPPEKRPRFENHIQMPKYPGTASFDDYGYNRLFSSNGNNAILEKIALNEIFKKRIIPAESSTEPIVDIISNQLPSDMGAYLNNDCNAHLSMLQNLNLLSLLSPSIASLQNLDTKSNESVDESKNKIKTNFGNNTNTNNFTTNINNSSSHDNSTNNTATLSVKNWVNDPTEKNSMNFMIDSNISITKINKKHNYNSITNSQDVKDSNNNLREKFRSFAIEVSSDANFPPALPLGLSQIPNVNKVSDAENGNAALLEWCTVFNASLNFLALAAAAAALQHNGAINATNNIKKEENILYKELTKSTNNFDSKTNIFSLINSDISNDSYFDSEPEDLSVRSTATSKLSSPANSRSQSPIKNNDSCPSLQTNSIEQ